jgi:UDP-N-acetylmuramate dehydrogenase
LKLADYTTLGLGGPAGSFISATTDDELIDAVSDTTAPVLVLGGGSNLVVADEGFPGTVVHVATRGIEFDGNQMTVAAGEPWDTVVEAAIAAGLAGLECLSGIPGLAGATPIQNVGAYGQEVSDTLREVRVYDRENRKTAVLQNDQCCFSYRTSLFRGSDRYIVLSVTFSLSPLPQPPRYAELAALVAAGTVLASTASRAPTPTPGGSPVPASTPTADATSAQIRAAVLTLRRRKGMVIDPADPETRNCGSFFTNPIVVKDLVPLGAPAFDAGNELVKVPAAWLIEHAGFHRGYAGPDGVRISAKHTLALVNDGNGTTASLLTLAREIRDGVHATFGITLTPEPILIGATL